MKYKHTPHRLSGYVLILIIASTVTASSGEKENLVNSANWYPAVDPFGSKYSIDGDLITDGVVSVGFTIAQRPDPESWIPWVELVCDPGFTLEDYSGLTITYRNNTDLLVKLSQSDFGPDGNATYAHYQYSLPASKDWNTQTIEFNAFQQPAWTPDHSSDIPLTLLHVDAIYLVPDLDYNTGESTVLHIKYLELLQIR